MPNTKDFPVVAASSPSSSSSAEAEASASMKSSISAARRTRQILHQLQVANHHHHHPIATTPPTPPTPPTPSTPSTPAVRAASSSSPRSMSPSAPPAAPWRTAFLSHIEGMDSPSFSLSTIHANANSTDEKVRASPGRHQHQYVPRVRTVIFRGMWASLPVNPKNPADQNPDAFDSDMPTITTDVRMEKVPQLLVDGDSASSSPAAEASSVGGPFEAVFWAEKDQTQWRLRGFACVVGPDIESHDAAPVRHALQSRMRGKERSKTSEAGGVEPWSWSREVTAHFGNMSPTMRGSFRNPPPGTPFAEKPREGSGLAQGQSVQDLHDELARRNFRVIVLVPEEVERLDLSDPKSGRRWMHTLDEDGAWRTVELWP